MSMNNPSPILCVSLNAAIDRRIWVPRMVVGEVNRASRVDPAAGGKAAHVAFAAKSLGAHVRWLGFLGGAEGESCLAGISAREIDPVAVQIAARTRTNLEIIDESSGVITEILEPGPVITSDERGALIAAFERELASLPLVVISGSLPGGIEKAFYATLVQAAKDAGCGVFLDASGDALELALEVAPDVIKPNRQESRALLGREIQTVDEAIAAAKELQRRGPKTVIISLGAEGAVAVGRGKILHAQAPAVRAISTVGSGDSFLAGWALETLRGAEMEECLRLAIACGTANCLAESPGMVDKSTVFKYLQSVVIVQKTV
jgi:1-phosphofructokinase family hexose kinase